MKGKTVNGICVILAAVMMVSLGMGLKINSTAAETKREQPAVSQRPEVEHPEAESPDEETPVKKEIFSDAPEGYFEDALFIGDSRTVGLAEYGNIEGADFFATTGMSVYNIYSELVNVPDLGRVDFETLLKSRQYKKVYVMLGINELGYGRDATAAKYGKLLELIKEYQPESIIFVEANLHVSKERSDTDSVFNNRRIDEYNEKISQFADNESVFYIDVNPVFDDGDGNLADKYTSDHSHILAKYYENWREWLKTKAVLM